MIGLLCFVLAVLASPFKSKLRLEAENAVLRHQLIVVRRRLPGRVRRHFKPPICLRLFQRAAEDDITSFVDGTMNANSATKPGMMPIKNLAKNRPVGVLKPRCTIASERAGFSPGSANRCDQFTRHPGRASSPLRPSLSCRYTQPVGFHAGRPPDRLGAVVGQRPARGGRDHRAQHAALDGRIV
jgi:hypothetical protein